MVARTMIRVGKGSTFDADYAWTWDRNEESFDWDGGYTTTIGGRRWVVVVA